MAGGTTPGETNMRPVPLALPWLAALPILLAGCGAAEPPAGTLRDGMVWIPSGRFTMGSADPAFEDANQLVDVKVDGFWLDATEVTNDAFAAFVKATGYVTDAERPTPAPDPAQKGLPPGSFVFVPPPPGPDGKVQLDDHWQWWRFVEGAQWRHPNGPASTIDGLGDHPAVHISWNDASAYCLWAGKRLPTEAEWERAARGPHAGKTYPWGDELRPDGKWINNIWQGRFPGENTREDGYAATAPVRAYPPSPWGLHQMSGNVWEWCSDWFAPDTYWRKRANPAFQPAEADSHDPNEPGVPKRVQRGGSFLCSDLYCIRYRLGSRGKGEPVSAACHVGFRCAKSAD